MILIFRNIKLISLYNLHQLYYLIIRKMFLAAREQLNNAWCMVSEWVSEWVLSSVSCEILTTFTFSTFLIQL